MGILKFSLVFFYYEQCYCKWSFGKHLQEYLLKWNCWVIIGYVTVISIGKCNKVKMRASLQIYWPFSFSLYEFLLNVSFTTFSVDITFLCWFLQFKIFIIPIFYYFYHYKIHLLIWDFHSLHNVPRSINDQF